MKNLVFAVSLLCTVSVSWSQHMALAFRSSVDYGQQILYLSPTLALIKEIGKDDAGNVRYWYKFVTATEGPMPDLGSVTGDRIDAVLINNPIRFSVGRQYLVGEFSDYDWERKTPVILPFAIRLDSNQVVKGVLAQELLDKVLSQADTASEMVLRPVQLAFDKYMIEYLRGQADKVNPTSRP